MRGETRRRYPFAVIRERLRERRGQVVDLALGGSPLATAPQLQELVRSEALAALRPASVEEVERYRETACRFLERLYGCSLDAAQILAVGGGRPALQALAAQLLDTDTAVLVTEPGYPVFPRLAARVGAEVVEVVLEPESEFAPDFSALEVQRPLHLAALSYPHNPTGVTLDHGVLAEIARALDCGGVIFNDASYGPLTHDAPPTCLVAAAAEIDMLGEGQGVLELHTLAKLFSLGPLSTGFFVGSAEIVQELRDYTEFAWSPMSSLQLQLGTHSLADAELLESVRGRTTARVRALRETLLTVGFRPYPTPSGLYVLCSLPHAIDGVDVKDAGQAAELLFDRLDLAVMPWQTVRHQYLRFSSLCSDADLEALAALAGRIEP